MKKVLSIILVLALIASAACAVVFNGQKNDLQKQNETLTADIAAVKADLETAKTDAEAAAAAATAAAETAAAEAAADQEAAVAAAKAEAEEAAKTAAEAAAADKEAAVAAAKAEAEEAAKAAAEAAAADKEAAVAAVQAELDAANAALAEIAAKKDIIVLFTSDVHCGIEDGFGYEGLAALRKELAEKNHVLLVDNGDSIQGAPVGTMTKGEAIIELMNAVGYDVATMGNHEFDYGMDTFLALTEKAEFPYVSANFTYKGEPVFAPYVIKDVNGVKIAFVGVTTPKTFTSSTPTYFQDENGNYVYGFSEDDTGAVLYAAVQSAVDAAKAEGANYVVVMAHLGIEEECSPWTSSELILNTTGIDALLDGHSHTVDPSQIVKNKDGKAVLMAGCGTKLESIGYLKISADGRLETGLYVYDEAAAKTDEEMAAALENATAALNAKLAEVVAKTDVALIINDPETGVRVIRNTETNLGHLVADAYKAQTGADVAMVNGGGIRADIPAGDITLEQIMNCHPFGNSLCMKETTGQHILDALEWASRLVPDQNGGFLHVAGMTYEIHSYIPSSCTNDDKGNFTGVTGEYRVKNVMINGQPLDVNATYTVASHNYMLKEGGDGTNMFKDDDLLLDEIKLDYQVVIDYIVDTLNGVVGEEYAEIYPVERIIIIPEAPVAEVEEVPVEEPAAEEPAAEAETPNVVGTWTLTAITVGENAISPAMMGLTMNMILNEDGTCVLQETGSEDVAATWTQNGTEIVIEGELVVTYADGTLTIAEESMGATLVFTPAE